MPILRKPSLKAKASFFMKGLIDIFEKINKTMNEKPQVILDLEKKQNIVIHRWEIDNNNDIKYLWLFINDVLTFQGLSDLKTLKILKLNRNRLTDISFLSFLTNLVELDLSENEISDIAPLTHLKKLITLNISNNRISNILYLAQLSNLNSLKLNHNYLSNIDYLVNLQKLNSLDITQNQISEITPQLVNLIKNNFLNIHFDNLNLPYSLSLYGNPLDSEVIKAIKSDGKKGLLKYLEAKDRSTIRIPEAKMVLLGEPRAGKTTLQKYLMGLPINEKEESTPDIQISSWKPFDNNSEDKNKDIKINLWDFGGQEIQYSLHKLFMTEDTLYIIVLDSTKDQGPLKYLKFLENYAPNSPFIIINNYGDAPTSNTLKIDENYLRENYTGKDGMPILKAIFNRVSILKAAKLDPSFRKIMDDVEVTIKSELLNLKNLNKEFPKEYQLVKSAIEQEYSKPDKHYITMSYYRERCSELQITDDEELRIAILLYLNQIGVLRYFKDSPVTDRHILNPKWLIDGAYSFIIDEETQLNQGVLSKEQALRILKKSNKFKFFDDEAVYIFKTMNFYGLLYYEEKEDKIYIPIRFGSNQPITLHEFYEQGQHFVFEFKGDIPEDIMPTLIVRHFSEIKNRHYWSKGAVFTNGEVKILVKIEDRSIHFYIIGKYHQTYFGVLRNTLIKILDLLPGLLYSEMVDFEFEDKKIRARYEDLIIVLNENWGDYRDYATKTKIDGSQIIKILGGYFSSGQIGQITNVTNNNFYGNYNDNRHQQITIIHELNSLVQSTQNIDDRDALEEIRSEIQLLNQTKDSEKRGSLGKKLISKIKQLSNDSLDDIVKDKLKRTFPKNCRKRN